jgi:hypothetical protein
MGGQFICMIRRLIAILASHNPRKCALQLPDSTVTKSFGEPHAVNPRGRDLATMPAAERELNLFVALERFAHCFEDRVQNTDRHPAGNTEWGT